MKETSPITMKDIARELGVSVATVSRALKDSPRISQEKREAIKAFAEEHHFFPNVIAESLRNSRTKPVKVIGVIIPQFTHFYFSSILSGIEEEASARGYRIMVAQSNEKYGREVEICKSFYENKVCGIIVSQAKDTIQYDHFQHLIDHGVPLVFYDRICTGVNCSRVVVDDYAMVNKGLQPDERFVKLCDNRTDAEVITPDILADDDRPDAFFAVNDDTAIGILYTAKRMGLRVPEDISICGFTNGQRAIACDPMLTTVEQRGMVVGEEAANILIGLTEGSTPKGKVEKRVVRTRLIVRGTTR